MRIPAAFLTLAALTLSSAASAAEVIFPPGSRIGLAPPTDMDVSQRFTGFESRSKSAVITAVEMPAEAFKGLTADLTPENLKRQGVTMTSRETFKVGSNEAVLVEGNQAGGNASVQKWLLVVENPTMTALVIAQSVKGENPDAVQGMREALRTVAIRAPRDMDEQVSSLPFRFGDMAGFRPVRVMTGNSILLTEGPDDVISEVGQPAIMVAYSTAVPPRDQRDAFARAALRSNALLKDIAIERAQSFRQRGADWHEIVARATDVPSGRPVVVTQALRFAQDHYLRVFGMVRAEARDSTLSRFRAVSDSVEPK